MSLDRTQLRWNGWGWAARKDDFAGRDDVWARVAAELGMPALLATPPRPLEELDLPATKLSLPDHIALRDIAGADQVRDSAFERAFHARGRSTADLLALRSGDLSTAPDAVVYPRGRDEVLQILKLAAYRNIAVVPFGSGTSAVGGVTPVRGDFDAVITLDLSQMDRVITIDPIAATATAEAGITAPALETALKTKGFTLGAGPQPSEFATLGGVIAQSVEGARGWLIGAKIATARGFLDIAPQPTAATLLDLIAGSEGTLGIITEATVRLARLPATSEWRGYLFGDFASGLAALRTAAQNGCNGTEICLSDAEETRILRALAKFGPSPFSLGRLQNHLARLRGLTDKPCLVMAKFEGDDATVRRRHFAAIAGKVGALDVGRRAGELWGQSRTKPPYLRDSLLDHGAGMDSIETAASWSLLPAVYDAVKNALETAIRATAPRDDAHGIVMGHVRHTTADGAGLVFTYVYPRAIGSDLEQCRTIKAAGVEAVLGSGGALSPRHGIGLDLLPYLARSQGKIACDVLLDVKKSCDPEGILNPGKRVS